MDYFKELIQWIKKNKPSKEDLAKQKVKLCKKLGRKNIPTDIEIYLNADDKDASIIRKYVETKPTRTGSGVAVVATMMKPYKCPHGKCIICPGGVESNFGDMPQSYTGKEPSTMRGIRNEFDSYRIIFNRLEQYIVLGHDPRKVDQIIMGGTFILKRYQKEFIHYSFKAYNDFSKLFYRKGKLDMQKFKRFFELPGKVDDETRKKNIKKKVLKIKKKNVKSLLYEQKRNEKAAVRCIGITIETRPENAFAKQGKKFLELGITRVELGVQSIHDECLSAINRGHSVKDSKKSIAELRDLGFKLNFHLMVGLPGKDMKRISWEKDIENFKSYFQDEELKPDMLKIYPCMVMPDTKLEKWYKKEVFKPLTTEKAAEMIAEGYRYIPEYCRVMRVQRDIPSYLAEAGVDKTNLKQYIDKIAEEKGIVFKDIRSREIRREKIKKKAKLKVKEYNASNGKEFFISMESEDKLLGFVRMRFPGKRLHKVITSKSALIRELHVYGTAAGVGSKGKVQHKGIGKKLMIKAETIAKKENKEKMIVISGVGVRQYYRKLGYRKQGPYMVKKL